MFKAIRNSVCCGSRPRSQSEPSNQSYQINVELSAAKESLRNATEGIDDPNAPPPVRLLRAGTSGNIKVIQEYLEDAMVDVHRASNKQDDTILHQAATSGQTSVIQLLVKTFKGTRDEQISWINARNNAHETAVFLACAGGHLDTAKALIAAGADVNLANFYGETPLYVAAYWGHGNIINHLLTELDNPPVLRANADGTTPAGIAAVRGHKEVAKMLDRFVKDRLSTGNSRVFGAWGMGTVTVKQVPYISTNAALDEINSPATPAPTVEQLQAKISTSLSKSASKKPAKALGAHPASGSLEGDDNRNGGTQSQSSSFTGLRSNVFAADGVAHSL